VDWSTARREIFPDLQASTTTISLRLPSHLLADLKRLANRRDVPYQSLLKVFLAERLMKIQPIRTEQDYQQALTRAAVLSWSLA
jgi:hypothetical protein